MLRYFNHVIGMYSDTLLIAMADQFLLNSLRIIFPACAPRMRPSQRMVFLRRTAAKGKRSLSLPFDPISSVSLV